MIECYKKGGYENAIYNFNNTWLDNFMVNNGVQSVGEIKNYV